ncbi:TolC family protein [Ancylomarina sp. 16SWW S1-10-2]|uniref:TolC family protein n=1 Tax=Ancylomarina sp. 16SWW S1-10-2 TaxID=2499681 RepID=UPI0012AD6C2D|nr:TolC family protein [Ancylomarina sp. 16SWW S1-10-2]MRT92774.1 TolC family protein [Ancylomarina sp. 16SWW S1-10-2]
MRSLLIGLFALGLSINAQAQSDLKEVLHAVENNNLSLKAQNQFIESQKIGYKTETNLANPELAFEKNFSDIDGNPYEILISQDFDFPTVYFQKNKIKKAKTANLDNLRQQSRQDILLSAEKTCLNLIYQNKQKEQLTIRYENAQKLVSFFKKKLDKGDANILEMNKVKIVLLNIKNQLQLCNTQVSNLEEELKQLNGGQAIEFNSVVYPTVSIDEDLTKLEIDVLKNTPNLNKMKADMDIASKQISLAKNQVLPKLSLGYRYLNSDINKSFNGINLGISIPLWESRNKVKFAKLNQLTQESQYLSEEKLLISDIQKNYQNYQGLKASLAEYRLILEGSHMNELLKKALDFGQISSIEYFMESIYFYDSYDTYLQVEKEYHLAVADLLKYQL